MKLLFEDAHYWVASEKILGDTLFSALAEFVENELQKICPIYGSINPATGRVEFNSQDEIINEFYNKYENENFLDYIPCDNDEIDSIVLDNKFKDLQFIVYKK